MITGYETGKEKKFNTYNLGKIQTNQLKGTSRSPEALQSPKNDSCYKSVFPCRWAVQRKRSTLSGLITIFFYTWFPRWIKRVPQLCQSIHFCSHWDNWKLFWFLHTSTWAYFCPLINYTWNSYLQEDLALECHYIQGDALVIDRIK